MTDSLNYLTLMLLIFLAFVFLISAIKQNQPKQRAEPKPKIKAKSRTDEVMDSLDWMLSNQIITSAEYTKLLGKCLPFLEG